MPLSHQKNLRLPNTQYEEYSHVIQKAHYRSHCNSTLGIQSQNLTELNFLITPLI